MFLESPAKYRWIADLAIAILAFVMFPFTMRGEWYSGCKLSFYEHLATLSSFYCRHLSAGLSVRLLERDNEHFCTRASTHNLTYTSNDIVTDRYGEAKVCLHRQPRCKLIRLRSKSIKRSANSSQRFSSCDWPESHHRHPRPAESILDCCR